MLLQRFSTSTKTPRCFRTSQSKSTTKAKILIYFQSRFQALSREKLTKRYLLSLVTARAKRLQAISSFTNLEELEKYSDETVTNVYFLILEGCGVRNVHADHAASHLGKAQGIVQQLR